MADESKSTAESSGSSASTKDIADDVKDFVKIGRTGRRNAVADVIADPNLNISTVNLTELMMKMNCAVGEDDKSKDES